LSDPLTNAGLVLTPEEIRKLTGFRRSDAQARELTHLGIPFLKRRDNSLIVFREHVENEKTRELPDPPSLVLP